MLHTIGLAIPALLPSWRFFAAVAPSPRVEYLLSPGPEGSGGEGDGQKGSEDGNWREFHPRPAFLPFSSMLLRLFFNPHWNEQLFMVSCAERIMENPAAHPMGEIRQRIVAHLRKSGADPGAWLRFRLVFILREGDRLERHVAFLADAAPLSGDAG